MKYESFPIKSGGLMRCCIATIVQHTVSEEGGPRALGETPAEGMTMACMYESPENPPSILFKDGVWQWNRDEVMAKEGK